MILSSKFHLILFFQYLLVYSISIIESHSFTYTILEHQLSTNMQFFVKAVIAVACVVLATIGTVNSSPTEEIASLCCDSIYHCDPSQCGDVRQLCRCMSPGMHRTNFTLLSLTAIALSLVLLGCDLPQLQGGGYFRSSCRSHHNM
jgi:hypothetical protein